MRRRGERLDFLSRPKTRPKLILVPLVGGCISIGNKQGPFLKICVIRAASPRVAVLRRVC